MDGEAPQDVVEVREDVRVVDAHDTYAERTEVVVALLALRALGCVHPAIDLDREAQDVTEFDADASSS